ncbi:MAG: zinc-binding dehydrogenase [Kiritimatiellae bacterium]|nr:zinc-binding dehydrogenase [Kiritimatiellia bacterium]
MSQEARAIVFTNPNEVEIREIALPACGAEGVVCETIYTFVSPGTELRVLSGIQESKSKFPLIPGYSWVGRVIEVGAELTGWKEGDLVTGRGGNPVPGLTSMWGGQASHHVCDVTQTVLKLPDGADPWSYTPLEVAAIAWRGVSMAFPAAGETAVVVGQGLIGAFNALWLVHHGARVIAVDLVEARLARARKWGAAATVNPQDGDAREQIRRLVPDGADIVIESSSSKPGVELANEILRKPAASAMRTNYPVAALHGNAHFWPRLVYQATYTHRHDVGPGQLTGGTEGALVLKPGDRSVADRLQVMEQIRQGKICMDDIAEAPTPVEEAPDAYFRLRDEPGKYNTIVYEW